MNDITYAIYSSLDYYAMSDDKGNMFMAATHNGDLVYISSPPSQKISFNEFLNGIGEEKKKEICAGLGL